MTSVRPVRKLLLLNTNVPEMDGMVSTVVPVLVPDKTMLVPDRVSVREIIPPPISNPSLFIVMLVFVEFCFVIYLYIIFYTTSMLPIELITIHPRFATIQTISTTS